MGPTAGVVATPVTLGKTVDSADDVARLMIVTHYAGSKTVKVYAAGSGGDRMGTKAGYITFPRPETDDVNNVRLRSEGAYYFAEHCLSSWYAAIPEDAEAQHVYYYDTTTGEDDQATRRREPIWCSKPKSRPQWAGPPPPNTPIRMSTIHVLADTDGDPDTALVNVEVTAKIPEATAYDHIHFGVWAALGKAAKDGTHEIDDLGIGFVQNFSGSGMSGADMPNNGSAMYNGNWVATVQAKDEDGNGDMSLEHGVASIDAQFGDGDITATLTDLATLTGKIAGNQFSGTKAVATGSGLDAAADFDGTFSGAFYGAKGAEAGGVFDFASDDGDNEGGAFRGAFGGKK